MRTELSHLIEISLEVTGISARWDGFFLHKHPIPFKRDTFILFIVFYSLYCINCIVFIVLYLLCIVGLILIEILGMIWLLIGLHRKMFSMFVIMMLKIIIYSSIFLTSILFYLAQ